MSYRDAMDAIHMKMPARIPRTEYSASSYWPLVSRVSGMSVDQNSPDAVKQQAVRLFERNWQFDLTWSVDIYRDIFGNIRTNMGHAQYAADGSDFDNHTFKLFEDEEDLFKFDPYAVYGARDKSQILATFNQNFEHKQQLHPDQVVTCGVYVTLISGLLEIFGWDLLLTALGVDATATGQLVNRYTDWISQYFAALAESDAPVVMVHDDIAWTSGPFYRADWYETYIFQNYERLLEPLKRKNKKILYTSDGNYSVLVDRIAACGFDGFVMEPTTDLAAMAKKYGQSHVMIGNADCRILTYGTQAEIYQEVKRCLDIGRDCPGFFMATGNHIPSSVPVENALYYQSVYEELSVR